MNAYLKRFMRIAACLLLLLVGQAGLFTAAAWADKKLSIQFEGQSDGDTIQAVGTWGGHQYGPVTIDSDTEYNVGNWAQITLTVIPGATSEFSHWSEDQSGDANPLVFSMGNKATTVIANFTTIETETPQIDLTISGEGSVTLAGGSHNYTASDSGPFVFDRDEEVTLTATAAAGQVFSGWSGDFSGSNPLTMDADKAVTATFAEDETPPVEPVPQTLTLTFDADGGGSGSVTLTGSPDYPEHTYTNVSAGDYEFFNGEQVTLHANADMGSQFLSWSGDLDSEVNPVAFTIIGDIHCAVSFTVSADTNVPGCGSSTFTDYDSGFDATHFDLNNVSVSEDGYLQLQTGDDAIDPNNIIIPFEQEVAVTFLHEGAGFTESDFGWMLASEGNGGTRNLIYDNVEDEGGDGVLKGREGIDSNGDGTVDALDSRVSLGTFAAGSEIVFYLNVDDQSYTAFSKTSWNPDVYDGDCANGTKIFNLGIARDDGTDTCSSTGWLDDAALARADTLFDLQFEADDTQSLDIVNGELYPHVIVGTPDDKPNEWILGWEDWYDGGDTDHNDMVFQIERRTGGVAELQTSHAIKPAETDAYYTAVLFEVYDNIPCGSQTDINYYVSIDNGTNWVEITAWDTVKEYTLDEEGNITLGADVAYWSAGSPQYTFRSRRIDFSGLGLSGRQLIWKTVLSSEEETCIAEIIDVKLTGTVATHADISRASPVVQGNVLYTGSFETPTATTGLRGHLRAVRIYDPFNPNITNNAELWDAGAVLTAATPSTRNIYFPSITLATVTGEALATADGTVEDFSGTLAHSPVLAESVSITVGSETFTDKHTDVLEGHLGGTGIINRFTGEWEITPYEVPTAGMPVIANYSWYTPLPDLQAFTAGNVTNAMLDLDGTYVHGAGYRHDFNGDGNYTEADGDWLVNWVRGYSDGSSTKKDWVLDPIDHSVPAAVTPPGKPLWYFGTDITESERSDYSDFVTANKDRETILLVGSRSGMLHAFDAGQFRWGNNPKTADIAEQRGYFLMDDALNPDYGDGSEKWAFIPANLLSRLKNNYLKGEDRSFVDASPAVSDVFIDLDDGDGMLWRTVALCAEGNGGDTVFALDITDIDSPKFMWEFADPDLFRSRSSPAVAVLGRIVDAGTTKWAAFFVSGETYDDTLYPSIYVIDIADGSVIERIFLNCEPAGAGGVPSGQPAIVDTDGNGYIDRMYIGTDKGYLYKVNLPDSPDEAAYPISQCVVNGDFDYVKVDDKGTDDESDDETTDESVPVSQRNHPIYASPTVVVDNSLTSSGELQYNVRIFFGTGDSPYADEDIDTGNTTYYFFAYTDHAKKGTTAASDMELAWFEGLPAGHRIFASAFAAAGNVYFGTATSDTEDPCEGPNEGRIYAFSYSGKSKITDNDGNNGLQVGDIITTPLVEDEHLYIKTPDGLKSFGKGEYNNATKAGGLPYTRMRFWREIF